MMGSKPSIDIGVMVHGGRNWSSGLRFESFYISKQLSTSVLSWKLNGVALAPGHVWVTNKNQSLYSVVASSLNPIAP